MTPCPGACLCGAVRYRLVSEPLTCYACHCTECQRHTGSAFALSLIVPAGAIEVLSGEPAGFCASLADGRVKRGAMCGACATRLWGTPRRAPGVRVLRPGTLDEPWRFRPVAHLWTRSALPWVVLPAGVPRYETQPPFDELGALWRQARAEVGG
jgi:hypothetical protein